MSTLKDLSNALPKIAEKDQRFAKDLIFKCSKYGVSPGQQKWIDILVDRANGVEEVKVVGDVGNFQGVYNLFMKAKEHQKYPKLRLASEGYPVVLSMAGQNSTAPNTLNVTDGGSYGNNKWYGRVRANGEWVPGRDFPELGVVAKLLRKLGEKPEEVASEHGKMTGYCCFCNRHLEDEKSVAVGYGPVCAEKWGLKGEYKAAKPIFTKLIKEAA